MKTWETHNEKETLCYDDENTVIYVKLLPKVRFFS